jgi:hypothetical protein
VNDLRMIAFGGCNIRNPLYNHARLRHAAEKARAAAEGSNDATIPVSGPRIVGPAFMCYTVGEALQALACWRGEKTIPADFHDLCHMREYNAPSPANSPLDSCDVVLLEPNTSVEIDFEGYSLNRFPVLRLVRRVADTSPQAKRLSALWFKKGILARDEDARRDLAEQLVPHLADDIDRELLTAFFRGATGRIRDLPDGFRRVANYLDVPMGVVAFTWSYMPDGRALSWPDGFHGEVVAAAKSLGIPLIDPRATVQAAGLERALKDLRHYKEEFFPVIADLLIDFACSLASNETETIRRQ